MASNHLATKPLSRAKGGSAVHAAAYILRTRLEDERTGRVYDYSRKAEDVLFAGCFLPKEAPEWMKDTGQLWNGAEHADTRINSRTARVLQIGLHAELTLEQNRWLLQDFIRENFTRKGIAAEVAIHRPGQEGDERNIHAHVLLATRFTSTNGFAEKDRDSDRVDTLKSWRDDWEQRSNKAFHRHGIDACISMQSLDAQGIERTPEIHVGRVAMALERKGIATSRGDDLREVRVENGLQSVSRSREAARPEVNRMPDAANDNEKAANDNQLELARKRAKKLQPTMKPEPDKGFVSASERLKLEEQQREKEGGKATREALSGSHGEIADAIYELNKTMRPQVAQTIANSQTNPALRENAPPAAPSPNPIQPLPKEAQPVLLSPAPAPAPAPDQQAKTASRLNLAEVRARVDVLLGKERELDALRAGVATRDLQKELKTLTSPEYWAAEELRAKNLIKPEARASADRAPENPVADPRKGFVHDLVAAIKQLFVPARQQEANQQQPPLTRSVEMPAAMQTSPAQQPASRQVETPAAAPVGRIEPAPAAVGRQTARSPEPTRETMLGKLQRQAKERGEPLEVKIQRTPERRLERTLDIKRPQRPRKPGDPRD